LIEPGDQEALAEGIHALWSDRALADGLAERAATCVRAHYTIAQSADRLLEAYAARVSPQRSVAEIRARASSEQSSS
jgi:hypothetical protein